MSQLYRSSSLKSRSNYVYLEWRTVKTFSFCKQEVVVLTKLVFGILCYKNMVRYRLSERIQRQPVSFDNCRSLYESFLSASVMHYSSPHRCSKHRRNLTIVIANRQTKHRCRSADVERDTEIMALYHLLQQ